MPQGHQGEDNYHSNKTCIPNSEEREECVWSGYQLETKKPPTAAEGILAIQPARSNTKQKERILRSLNFLARRCVLEYLPGSKGGVNVVATDILVKSDK